MHVTKPKDFMDHTLPVESPPKTKASQSHPLRTVYFYLTKGCNLRCRHCWVSPPHETQEAHHTVLDSDLFNQIIDEAVPLGLKGIKLTGGEPLLHPQINLFLEQLIKRNLQVTIETNGTLCTKERAQVIARLTNCSVAVSVDGPSAEIHEWVRGVEGAFILSVEGIRNLVSAGVRPQIIMTVMRYNKEYMAETVRRAQEWGASSVKFNFVMPIARGKRMTEEGETLSTEELITLSAYIEKELSVTAKIPLYTNLPFSLWSLGNLFGRSKIPSSCAIFNIIGVLADGAYALCGIGESTPDFIFGHAGRDRLVDIWENTMVLQKIRASLPGELQGVCAKCILRNVCLGTCVAANYYHTGDILKPYWLCEELYQQDLFPLSRLRLA